MFRQRESNPHFLPRNNNDPTIEFTSQQPRHSRPPQPHATSTSTEPSHGPRPLPPMHQPEHGPMLQSPTHRPEYDPRLHPTTHQPEYGPRFQLPTHQAEPSLRTHIEMPPKHHKEPKSPKHHKEPKSPKHHKEPKSPKHHKEPKPPKHHKEPKPHKHHKEHKPHSKPLPLVGNPHHHDSPQPHHESTPHSTPHPRSNLLSGNHRHDSSLLRAPSSRRTKPLAWLVAAFCALFWILVIVGGLIILIIYLVFRPKNPRFDINAVTLNAAYLDMGYLLNADVTILANFTNPNTKVNVEFSYVIFELHYRRNFIATRYVHPFSVLRRESRFVGVHLVSSQVRLSVADSLELEREIESGRVILELRGMFRARSRLGGIFQYSYWLNARCQIMVSGPPTGVLIGRRCSTK